MIAFTASLSSYNPQGSHETPNAGARDRSRGQDPARSVERPRPVQPPCLRPEGEQRVRALTAGRVHFDPGMALYLPQHVVDSAIKNQRVAQDTEQKQGLPVDVPDMPEAPREPPRRGREVDRTAQIVGLRVGLHCVAE